MNVRRVYAPAGAVVALAGFVLLATSNSAGYRYGASDLAFYGPSVMRDLDPALFPRDRPVIDAQAQLTFMDETVGAIARVTTTDLPALFLGLYLLSLVLLAVAATSIGTWLYRSRWTVAALLAALTLRHAIAKSGTNTLEGYFHPRQLAFGFGACAVALLLRGHAGWTICALGAAALLHPTTTLWFVIWAAIAAFVSEPRWRRPMIGAAGLAAVASVWAVTAGPLAGRMVLMDSAWLEAIGDKDYLFPLEWPVSAWLLNLAYVPIIWVIYRRRVAGGLVRPRETGLVIGCLALTLVFLFAVALNAARVALAIQLQPARVFWMLDSLAVVYGVWALAEGVSPSRRRPVYAAAALLALSIVRGAYVMLVEFPDRPFFEATVGGDWGRVSAFARSTPKDTGWLADPGHASQYGTSLRMSAARDVFVEGTKDTAIGMYDRAVALRTRDRLAVLRDYGSLSPARARQLASEYDLDYMITEQQLDLPLAFESGPIRVYRLRERP